METIIYFNAQAIQNAGDDSGHKIFNAASVLEEVVAYRKEGRKDRQDFFVFFCITLVPRQGWCYAQVLFSRFRSPSSGKTRWLANTTALNRFNLSLWMLLYAQTTEKHQVKRPFTRDMATRSSTSTMTKRDKFNPSKFFTFYSTHLLLLRNSSPSSFSNPRTASQSFD